MPHLVVSISANGFGHVAQTAPVLNALHERLPQLHITVRSAVPVTHLRSRIHAPFTHLPDESDFGMLMSSALDVRVPDSCAAYKKFHAAWEEKVTAEADILRELKADLVFSNVAYLPLAGAQRAGIPNAAMCSLNWADIYRHYCNPVRPEPVEGHHAHASTMPLVLSEVEGSARMDVVSGRTDDNLRNQAIAAQIHECYAKADAFLRATPGMAMADLPNLIPVAPVAAVGTNRRDEINRRLKLSPDEKLVLISMGGIGSRLPIEKWPTLNGAHWLVQQSWQAAHPDAIVLETLQMSFNDLLASSDALICKPGYGSFAEAACSGLPVLYVNRPDWPESPVLVEWLERHGVCREVSRDALERGDIADTLSELWNASRPEPVTPGGVEQVADWLVERLGL